MKCKICSSTLIIKHGKVRNKQRYKCKDCGYNFVQGDGRQGKNSAKQRMALHLYLENMGFRAIGRVLGVSNVTVLNWIRKAGHWIKAYHERQERPERTETIELDEMWHFIGSKKENYGFGLHWTEEGSVYLTLLRGAAKLEREGGCGKSSKT